MKNLFGIIGIVSILALVGCGGGSKTNADPCPEKTAQILSLQKQVNSLQEQVLTLTTENGRLQGLLDCLETKVTITKVSSTKSSGSTVAKKQTSTGSSSKSSGSSASGSNSGNASALKSATIPKVVTPGTPSNANLDGLRENGIISFCVMANGDNGLHFPQKALDKGVTFTSIENNPSNDGHNWIVEPLEWIEGDYGLTVDGTFFVSDAMMTKVLQPEGIQLTSVLLKAPFTKWQKVQMYKEDGYWKCARSNYWK
jgi:hypothetical protein